MQIVKNRHNRMKTT